MTSSAPVLPITVLSAIFLFILKKFLETYRRHAGNRRKRRAMRSLLAVECERNYNSIVKIREILEEVRLGPEKIYLKRSTQGEILIGLVTANEETGTTGGTRPVPKAHKTYADRYLLETALLDKKLFGRLLAAYDALLELDWVSSSLIGHAETMTSGSLIGPDEREFFDDTRFDFDDERFDIKGWNKTFAEWGLEEMDGAYTAVDALYSLCSGSRLTEKRDR